MNPEFFLKRYSESSDDHSLTEPSSSDPNSLEEVVETEDDIPDEWKDDGQVHIFKRCEMVQQVSETPTPLHNPFSYLTNQSFEDV